MTSTHRMTKHPLFRTWRNKMRRCYDETDPRYPDWGGRGIRVFDAWHDPRIFVEQVEAEIGLRPKGYTLDRIDNDGHYEPGNIRWATLTEQQQNAGSRTGRSQYKGVAWHNQRNKWRAYIVNNYRQKHLGLFDDEEEAALAYNRAAVELFGDHANLNITGRTNVVS